MDLSKTAEQMKFDTRMIEINLKNNTLTAAELQAHLKNLPDESHRVAQFKLEESHKDSRDYGAN